MVFETEVADGILKMNCLGSIFGFTLEDSDVVMARIIEKLIEEKKVVNIVLAETGEYEYDSEQTQMLIEIANLISNVIKERKLLSIKNIAIEPCTKYVPAWYGWIRDLVTLQMRGDPIGAYLNLTREIRHLRTKMESSDEYGKCIGYYIDNTLSPLQELFEKCKLIQEAKPYLSGYHIGDRTLYRRIFKPTVRPNFMYTKFMAQPPPGETVAKYKLGDTDIEIFKVPEKVRYIYHATPRVQAKRGGVHAAGCCKKNPGREKAQRIGDNRAGKNERDISHPEPRPIGRFVRTDGKELRGRTDGKTSRHSH